MSGELFVSYWKWFLFGSGHKPGWSRLVNKWLLFHVIIGVAISFFTPDDIERIATVALLPGVGILTGLTFAWAGNAQALLQSKEVHLMADQHRGGFTEYVYSYQTAILTVLIISILWVFAGIGVFSGTAGFCSTSWTKIPLFSLSSLALRECWQVIQSAQWLLLAKKRIQDALDKKDDKVS